jgi:hypothetical protein
LVRKIYGFCNIFFVPGNWRREYHLSATPKRNQSAEYWNTHFGTYAYSFPFTALEIFFGFAHKRILFILVLKLPAKYWDSIQTVYYF